MSFVLFAAVAALAAGAAGALFARRSGAKDASSPAALPASPPLPEETGLALALGDVVAVRPSAPGTAEVDRGSRERWLAGALVAREDDAVVAAVFFAPEGARLESVLAHAKPRTDIAWLSEVEIEVGDEPPSVIEIGGKVLDRVRRIPVKVERLGRGAPRVGASATWAEYATGREVAVVVRGQARTLALVGVRLDEGEYERMGSGGLA